MNSKWYISTLIILLALIGLNQEQTKVANQQIVLQFSDVEMTSEITQDDALAKITQKLQDLGIADIEITENEDKQLSIRYYSVIDAESVREFLSQDSEFSVVNNDVDEQPSDFPKEKLPENFSLIVSDLQQSSDDGLGINGILALELNQDNERFSNPLVLQFANSIVLGHTILVDVAFKINRDATISIDNTSHNIPEIRAGPSTYRNS